jgi:hypothetical protein
MACLENEAENCLNFVEIPRDFEDSNYAQSFNVTDHAESLDFFNNYGFVVY